MHRPRKRFGQHFLHDPGVIDDIVGAIAPLSADTVVEIGPGQGAITTPLARLAGKLHLIEFDRDLAGDLRRQYRNDDRVTVHECDALRFDFAALGAGLRIVGNLPYNISTPLLFHLLDYRDAIQDMHFMLQKEVVDRMAAEPGTRDFGRLTVMLGCALQVAHLFDVPPAAFSPPPKVTSAVVRLAPLPKGTYHVRDHAQLKKIVSQAFTQRRKTIRNALRQDASEQQLLAAGIDPATRPETVSIHQWIELANLLHSA
ncbi:MAG: 16S rRNA (adenine(1518)-N(6)/adenine(1519)-N(6))-dimethyltransferase RsmA [Woeseia sp.]|nr:16S rRNA (adenine(1518)-N(6)/adenine(1519)-N(6))-dimethyltransferase RsmA [Woeseia sp.]MBT8096312.1 16S rRNA (adenine(1518)-N(6)/adenine(1519)-N(6))-dimethyltransferase RsmA [Woeseia sp.]NNE60130.1 16S rRNA (adenine(1518)-N(6)/adenine(1519)-N(6))-dimethyltransferase RsmA [Woeseia sp.]NNL54531.1 16S rRNA (adenine(1518)-N(6)/adenine(1519)-N(6))-dimethyltransferase RsmA [Woeseia sp.]